MMNDICLDIEVGLKIALGEGFLDHALIGLGLIVIGDALICIWLDVFRELALRDETCRSGFIVPLEKAGIQQRAVAVRVFVDVHEYPEGVFGAVVHCHVGGRQIAVFRAGYGLACKIETRAEPHIIGVCHGRVEFVEHLGVNVRSWSALQSSRTPRPQKAFSKLLSLRRILRRSRS